MSGLETANRKRATSAPVGDRQRFASSQNKNKALTPAKRGKALRAYSFAPNVVTMPFSMARNKNGAAWRRSSTGCASSVTDRVAMLSASRASSSQQDAAGQILRHTQHYPNADQHSNGPF